MNKILAVVLTLILAFSMTSTAFAAEAKQGGEATMNWSLSDAPEIIPQDKAPTSPQNFKAHADPSFTFPSQQISGLDVNSDATNRAGIVISNGTGVAFTLQFKMSDFDVSGTKVMEGYTLTLKTPQNIITTGSGGAWTTQPATTQAVTANNLCTLAKSNTANAMYGVSWAASLKVTGTSVKKEGDAKAVIDWIVTTA